MFINDVWSQITLSLFRHKTRSCLAMFGIIWGTVSVILLLALSNGFYEKQMEDLSFLKNATIVGWPGTTTQSFAGIPQGSHIHIDVKDFLNITDHIPAIKKVSPMLNSVSTIHYKDKDLQASIQGVAVGFDQIMQITGTSGSRFINKMDILEKNRVVFLDDSVKKTLLGDHSALQKTITVGGIPFTVIGVSDPDQKGNMRWEGHTIFMPYTTLMAHSGQRELHTFFILPNSAEDVKFIKHDLIMMLAQKYHFNPADDEAIHMPDLEKPQMFITWFFRAISLFLGFCGGLTLSVGGLGIANMMFLIVTERTREIGMRMAIGANDQHILLQFLCETLLLVVLGGLIGFIISGLLISLSKLMTLPTWVGTPHISGLTVMITLVILILVGTVAGYFPARRAAHLVPVQALAF